MNESINKEENKARFRKLVKMYHPDNQLTGDLEMMKKLNRAKETDETFEAFFNELDRVSKKKEEPKNKRPARFKTDEEWERWLSHYERIKEKRAKEQERVRKAQRK
jgi:curved DNA-binding protein CbpA